MAKFYWTESSDATLNGVYNSYNVFNLSRFQYKGKALIWRGKTSWFRRLPLFLALETDQEKNEAGIIYVGSHTFCLTTNENGTNSNKRKDLDKVLERDGIDKKAFFESFDKIIPNIIKDTTAADIHELAKAVKKRITLERLLDELNPSRENAFFRRIKPEKPKTEKTKETENKEISSKEVTE